MIYVTKPTLPEMEEYQEMIKGIWKRSWLTNNGLLLQELEENLKSYLGVSNLSVVSNATLGLMGAIYSLKLKGDVITTPFTFAATTNAIVMNGLRPVFADVDKDTFNINPADVEKKITERTAAILAVHVFGNPCDMENLESIAKKHNLKLIYDAAHSFGSRYKGKSICEYGDVSVLSFHAVKLFNTVEGGAVVSKNNDLIKTIELYRNFGIESEENVSLPGINAKMSEFHAAMGLCNLRLIDKYIKRNEYLYGLYLSHLKGLNLNFQFSKTERDVYTYMPVCFDSKTKRDEVYEHLLVNGYSARKYFYPLTSDFDYFKTEKKFKISPSDLSNARTISDTILCLPFYPTLEENHIIKVCNLIREVCDRG